VNARKRSQAPCKRNLAQPCGSRATFANVRTALQALAGNVRKRLQGRSQTFATNPHEIRGGGTFARTPPLTRGRGRPLQTIPQNHPWPHRAKATR
jgi:hypothetical protein